MKRGVSTIVATVLIVLVTVAAVTILWAGVYPLLSQSLFIEDVNVRFQIQKGEFTAYDSTNDLLSVRVTRGADEADIKGLRFIIGYKDGSTVSHISYSVVSPNSANVYYFSVKDVGSVVEYSVAPIYNVKGNERESKIVNTIEKLQKKDLTDALNSKNIVLFEGKEDFIFNDGLVSWFKLDGDYKDIISGLTGICYENCPKQTVGIKGDENGAYLFDGFNDSIMVSGLNGKTNSYTFLFWIKPRELLGVRYFFNYGGLSYIQWVALISNNKIKNTHGYPSHYNYIETQESIPVDIWSHVAITWDGTTIKSYFNGVLGSVSVMSSPEGENYPYTTNSGDTFIGNIPVAPGNFNGSLDEIMVYNRPLTAEEIKNIYEASK